MTEGKAGEIAAALLPLGFISKRCVHPLNVLHVQRVLPGELGALVVWAHSYEAAAHVQLYQGDEHMVQFIESIDTFELVRVAALLIQSLENIAALALPDGGVK